MLAAIGAVVYFLIGWYFVDMTQLNILSCDTQEMVVELVSSDEPSRFVLTCTDSYGNAYPGIRNGNLYTFSDLSEKTTYTVAVSAAQYHKLRKADSYTISVTTPESTAISDFRGVRGDNDGEVQLSFSYEGPAPSQWQLTCSNADGSVSNTYSFVGSSYIVSGLLPNEVYTFTLEDSGDIFLSGETTTQYEILPIVEAKNLTVSEIDGKKVTLSWEQVAAKVPWMRQTYLSLPWRVANCAASVPLHSTSTKSISRRTRHLRDDSRPSWSMNLTS